MRVIFPDACDAEEWNVIGPIPLHKRLLGEKPCLRAEGEELHRLNVWLYEASELLAVQVHAHPNEAYHSDTDNAYPIVATLGGISIVAAEFCRAGLFATSTAIYRLKQEGWVEVPTGIVRVT